MPKRNYKQSKSHKLAISKANTGHKTSRITRLKISLALSKKVKYKCDYCGKFSSSSPSHYIKKRHHFCCQNCYGLYRINIMKPHEQPSWRGGITRKTQLGRGNKKYKIWQQAVFKRDNYSCIVCNSKKYLEAHHIKSWANHPELRYDIRNGETRCRKHHDRRKKQGVVK